MKNPNVVKWSLKYGIMSALAGILCCVAPAILFMFGLMGGVVAISFADFFYSEDGTIGMGSIILRIIGFGIGCIAVFKFREKQNQCSIDPKRKKNKFNTTCNFTFNFWCSIFLGNGFMVSLVL